MNCGRIIIDEKGVKAARARKIYIFLIVIKEIDMIIRDIIFRREPDQ